MRHPAALIEAVYNYSKAKSATAELANGLEPSLRLSIECKVMLRANLWAEKNLVDGALGHIEDIIYEENHLSSDQMPSVIMVRFYKYSHITYDNTGCVRIAPITKHWKDGNVVCSRKKFPRQLAFAITTHKSQVLTLDKAAVDIGHGETSLGLTYVALSRVRTLQGLAFSRKFPLERFKNIQNSRMLLCRINEETRMKSYKYNSLS